MQITSRDGGRFALPAPPSIPKGLGYEEPVYTSDYRIDPVLARRIRRIDPNLVIRWCANAQWWVGPRHPSVKEGGWDISIRGKSGKLQTLRYWPPWMADSRLVSYLEDQWLQRLRKDREFYRNNPAYQPGIEYAERSKAFGDRLERETDIDDMWRQACAGKEPPKWRSNWQVAASTPPRLS